jgi:outer membrane protein assembly factor BamB
MKPIAPRIALAVAFVAFIISSCGTVRSPAAPQSSGSASGAAGTVKGAAPSGCSVGPPRRAWAELVSGNGQLRWRQQLPTNPTMQGVYVQPLPVQGSATDVFAEYDTVYGLAAADGHQVWHWAASQWIYNMWPWHGAVIVLSGQASSDAQLTALDAASGAVRWSLRLPQRGLLGSQALTADGGLAMITPDGVLAVADLTSGHIRWSRQLPGSAVPSPEPTPVEPPLSPVPVAEGRVVVGASGGRAVGFDSRTGATLWTASGLPGSPGSPLLQAAAGLVLVTSGAMGPGIATAVTALSPATGRVAWRFDPGGFAFVAGVGPAGIALSASQPDFLFLVDPVTGQVRWKAATFVDTSSQAGQPPVALVTARDVITPEGQPGSSQRIVDRSAATGAVRWAAPVSGIVPAAVPLLTVGPWVITVADPSAPGDGTLAAVAASSGRPGWQVSMPAAMFVPPAAAGGDVLAQSADPSYGCASGGGITVGGAAQPGSVSPAGSANPASSAAPPIPTSSG